MDIEWEEKEWVKDDRRKLQYTEEFKNNNFKFSLYLFISPNSNGDYVGSYSLYCDFNNSTFYMNKEKVSDESIEELKKKLNIIYKKNKEQFLIKFNRFKADFNQFQKEVITDE